jgi:hypothetical protein
LVKISGAAPVIPDLALERAFTGILLLFFTMHVCLAAVLHPENSALAQLQ